MMLRRRQSQFESPGLSPSPATTTAPMDGLVQPSTKTRSKRKAESQNNERLSKRLSLLNLEHNGPKLYVPVETTSAHGAQSHPDPNAHSASLQPTAAAVADDDAMRIDDTKHKVYIYNIDDELSSDSEVEDGKLVFLPDIDKHLRQNRIPQHVLASDDGQLAGMQLVVYSDPKSLTVPEDEDNVRKAVIEARHRLREKQRRETAVGSGKRQEPSGVVAGAGEAAEVDDGDAMDMD